MMTKDEKPDIETKLAADASGNYKKRLINLLKQYKDEFEELKSTMLPTEKYKQYEHMSRAIDAAMVIIESKRSARKQDHAFNSIF